MNFNEPVYTTEEVAKRYRVEVATVQRWVQNGRITALDLGGGHDGPFVFRLSDLEEFERNAEVGKTTKPKEPSSTPKSTRTTLDTIRQMSRETLTPAIVAGVIGCDPHYIRLAAREVPEQLGFPTIVMGSRVLIPREAFLQFMEGEQSKEHDTTSHTAP